MPGNEQLQISSPPSLTLRTFREEQLADQLRYFNFSSYLAKFRADQSKKAPCMNSAKGHVLKN